MSSRWIIRKSVAFFTASLIDQMHGSDPPGKMYRLMKSTVFFDSSNTWSGCTMAWIAHRPSGRSLSQQTRRYSSMNSWPTASIISIETTLS